MQVKNVQQINKGKNYLLFSFLFIGLFFLWYSQIRKTSLQYLDEQGIAHTLSLPVKDKKRLFDLMQILFAHDSFAYTILGSKPLAWATYRNPWPFEDREAFCNSFSRYNRVIRLGWKTWQKYSHLFPNSHFWSEALPSHPGWVSILIVNEERFNEVVNSNKKDFETVLHREVENGHQLLKESHNCSLMHGILNGHQALMGIVLGYGRNNSWKFLKSCETRIPMECVWGNANDEILKGGRPLPEGMTLTESYLSLYSCPSFAGEENSEESLALKKDYLLAKEKVLSYYKDKDFLEATLSLLAGYRPL